MFICYRAIENKSYTHPTQIEKPVEVKITGHRVASQTGWRPTELAVNRLQAKAS